MPCCCARDYEKVFGRKTAARDARRFRRRGLRGSAKATVALAGDVRGASVLEVGGGIGAIEIELLGAGAARATTVELSSTYETAAGELLAERGLTGRVERRVGDFVEEAGSVEPHDVVVMHRVVCCYPDVDALVRAAAGHALRRMVLTYPRQRRLLRIAFSAMNGILALGGSTFRIYVHPVVRIEAAARGSGLVPAEPRRRSFVWESCAFARPS